VGGDRSTEFDDFVAREHGWLEPDAIHDALTAHHGGAFQDDWREQIDRDLFAPMPGGADAARARLGLLRTLFDSRLRCYAIQQFVMAVQHAAWREHLAALGLTVWGDMQIGISAVDAWRWQELFLDGYLLGAPPSRTNPDGQPWGYPVLDPDQLGEDGAARALFRARVAAIVHDFDGLRIDHPHGLVCPWVYRAGAPDPYAAVRAGARLHESPDLPDHPELARYARVAAAQVRDGDVPRHADDWVMSLREEQIDAYAALLQDVVRAVESTGARASDRLACEVLSTRPTPLRAVIERLGLGRFRITQKADPDDPDDVYASERADPADWVMVGNHDTPPLWRLMPEWQRDGRAAREAKHLAARLGDPARARALAADASALVHAKVADALASPARHAMLFFADLFGLDARYNRPGEVHPDNWRLRVPSDWRERLSAPRAHRALDLDECLALALRMRGAPDGSEAARLVRRLTEGAQRTSTR
jgi:4-alpha-glucanotransferase